MIAAAMFLFGVVVGIVFTAACMAWDRPTPAPAEVDMRDFEANIRARWQG